MSLLTIELVTPYRTARRLQALSVTVPSHDGSLTLLPGHQPMICELANGIMIIDTEQPPHSQWSVENGHMTVAANSITIAASRIEELV